MRSLGACVLDPPQLAREMEVDVGAEELAAALDPKT